MGPRASRHQADASLTDLPSAVGEIRQACDELGNEAHHSPFFLISGAGISYPPVPLAASIIEHCKEVAGKYKRDAAVDRGAALDLYSHWFGRAYPGARQRQQYLRNLIEKKPLSLASLRLAHLLSARRLTNVVVTTNFDDFIARAVRLFGEEASVCDHPRTIGRIDRDLPDIQIVHVHGSYLFYDLANLSGEVTARARTDKETSFTMMGLLDSLLWARSPLVVGYSGWEGDVIMSALRRRLRGGNPLAQSIYWFCYRRSELERLPSWLRNSPDVRFVVPPPAAAAAVAAKGDERTGPTGERPPEPTMPAYEVFDRLNESFEVGTPAIFQNPIKYLAKTLEAALPEGDGTAGDPYAFKALIDRLNKAAASFEASTRPARGLEAELDKLRGVMRQSNYAQAIKVLSKLMPYRLAKLDAAARKEVLDAARLAGTALLSTERKTVSQELARVAVFDPVIERLVGEVPGNQVWCIASRSDQFGMEFYPKGDQPHGAFTFRFARAINRPSSDLDEDGKISILECAIEVSGQMAADKETSTRQTPVVVGNADAIALFAARPGGKRLYGTLHVVMVGVSKLKDASAGQLQGPVNDTKAMSQVLRLNRRRLYKKTVLHVLLDQHATKDAVTRAIQSVAADAAPADITMLYFSGHGMKRVAGRDGETSDRLNLVLYDFAMNDAAVKGTLTSREIAALLTNSRASHSLVVLDF